MVLRSNASMPHNHDAERIEANRGTLRDYTRSRKSILGDDDGIQWNVPTL